jgi:hypothetical protein
MLLKFSNIYGFICFPRKALDLGRSSLLQLKRVRSYYTHEPQASQVDLRSSLMHHCTDSTKVIALRQVLNCIGTSVSK